MALQGSALAAVAVVSAASTASPNTMRIIVLTSALRCAGGSCRRFQALLGEHGADELVPFRHACALFRHVVPAVVVLGADVLRSEEHTSELQSLMRISYAVFCLKKKNT